MARVLSGASPGWEKTAVLLDGVEIPFAIFADEEQGVVVCDTAQLQDDTPHITLTGENVITGDTVSIKIPTGSYKPGTGEPFWVSFSLIDEPSGHGLMVRLRGRVELRITEPAS